MAKRQISKSEKETYRQNAVERLRQLIKPGDKLYTIVKSCSGSGTYRHIAVIAATPNVDNYSPVTNISNLVTDVLDWKWHDDDSVGVSGCGMDMGFHVVHELSERLFPDGFGCIGRECPSNDHANGDRDYTPHEDHVTSPDHICAREPESCKANKHWHRTGGYALRREWL
jgi:hypothetical protein